MKYPGKKAKSSKFLISRSSAASRLAKIKGRLSVLPQARKGPGLNLATLRALDSTQSTGSDPATAVHHPQGVYETERAAYQSRKAELLRVATGKFVVLKGQELEGPFPDFRSALKAGRRKFGYGPVYVKQILVEDPAAHSGVVAESCRS